jgi:branched-chain amino acid transport system ATP-binding protein
MLEIRGLHTHYGLSHVIQGIDLVAKAGEVVGIFGRNGVGKTTLLKTVAGWVRPTAGEIHLDGVRIDGHAPDAIAHCGIGLVPEDRRIVPGLSVEENLRLGLMQRKDRSRADERRAIQEMFGRFPRLYERRNQPGNTLSGGEQQMLAMARVLVGAPNVLLIVEPTEGLAPKIVAQIFAIIRELKENGALVLLVEQNVHGALDVADRFYALERGCVVMAGGARSAADREALLAAITV